MHRYDEDEEDDSEEEEVPKKTKKGGVTIQELEVGGCTRVCVELHRISATSIRYCMETERTLHYEFSRPMA